MSPKDRAIDQPTSLSRRPPIDFRHSEFAAGRRERVDQPDDGTDGSTEITFEMFRPQSADNFRA